MIRKLLLFVRFLFFIFSNSSKEKAFTLSLRMLCLGMFFAFSFANAATITSTAAGGNWSTGSTWVGGNAPGAGDTVIIATTGAGAVDINVTINQTTAGSVTVNSGATLTSNTTGVDITFGGLTINSTGKFTVYRDFTVSGASNITGTINFGSTSTTQRNMTFTGAVTLNAGAIWNETTTGAPAQFSFGNDFTNNATTFTTQSPLHTFSGAGKTLNGSTSTAFQSVAVTGTYTNNIGTLTISTALSGGGGTLTNFSGKTLNIGGAVSITNFNNAGTANIGGSGAVSTAIANFVNTGTLNLGGTGTIAGITNNANGTVNLASSGVITTFNNATSSSVLQITATTPNITTLTTTAVGNTVNYSGTAQTIKTNTYSNLILSNSGTKTLGNTVTTTGTLTLNNNTNLDMSTYLLTLNGNLINNGTGTITGTTGGVTISGSNATQNITGFTTTGGVTVNKTAGVATFTSRVVIGGALSISSGTSADLSSVATHTAGTLIFNGNGQNNGTWGGSLAGSIYKNSTYFGTSSTGIITVATAACTSGYWIGLTSTDWNTASNWCGNTVPTAATDVIIPSGTPFSPLISGITASVKNLTINTSASLTVVDNSASILNITGNFTNSGTFSATGTSSKINFVGGNQTVAGVTYSNLTLSGSGIKTFATTPTVNNVLSMEGTATASAAPTYGSSATLQYNTTTSRTAGPEWIATFAASGGVIIANTGTITMNAAKAFSPGAALTINSGATLTTNNFALDFAGDFINNGTFTGGSSAITISGTGLQSIGSFSTTGGITMSKQTGAIATFTGNVTAGSLYINGSGGRLSLGSGLTHTITGDWLRGQGTLNGGSSTLKIGGNITGNGSTFTPETSTVEFNGGNQNLGSAAITYNNLTLSGSGSPTKTFAAITTASDTWTINSGVKANLGGITSHGAKTVVLAGLGTYITGSCGSALSGASNTSDVYFTAGAGTGRINLISLIDNNYAYYSNSTTDLFASVGENTGPLTLTAPDGYVFINTKFASYGTPLGTAPNYKIGGCHAVNSRSITTGLLGNTVATIPGGGMSFNGAFGDPCSGTIKTYSIVATYALPICSGSSVGVITGSTPTGGNGTTYTYLWEQSANVAGPYTTATGTSNAKDYTPPPITTTTYYRRTVTSGIYTDATIVIVPIISAPTTAPTITSSCSTLTASASPIAGTYVEWFSGSCGSAVVGTGLTYNPASTGNHYARYRNTCGPGSSCSSAASVTSTTNSISITPAASTSICSGTSGNSTVPLSYTATGSPTTYTITWSPPGYLIDVFDRALSGSPITLDVPDNAPAGTYTGTIKVKNSSGCVSAAKTFILHIGKVAGTASSTPTLCINTPLTTITHTTVNATAIGTALGLPAGVTASLVGSTINITGTPTASGTFPYTIPLIGPCIGSADATGTITVNIGPAGLTYDAASPVYCAGTAVTNNATLATTGIPAVSYSVSPALPTGLSISSTTGAITGTPTVATAAANYTVTATNSCGNTTSVINITVNIAPAGLTYGAASPLYCAGTAVTNNATLATTGVPAVSYSVSPALPTGLSINSTTGAITGTPSVATAAANYTVTATNSCGNTTSVINITVNRSPAGLTYGAASPAYCVGTAVTNNATLATTGIPAVAYSVSPALPTGLSISSTTGAITGTPTVATAATNYTVTATNSCGNTTSVVNITINALPTPPTAAITVYPSCTTNTATIVISSPHTGIEYGLNGVYSLSATFTNVAIGAHVISIKNSSGCIATMSGFLNVAAPSSKTWTGATNNDWNTGTNWTPAGVPSASDCVVIPSIVPASPTLSTSGFASNIIVNDNANLTVATGQTLTVTNGIQVLSSPSSSGNFTFQNNASLLQTSTDNTINSGSINYIRDANPIRQADYIYWSTPVTPQKLVDVSPLTLGDKYMGHDGTKWVITNKNSTMVVGKGYIIRGPQGTSNTVRSPFSTTFKGTPNNGTIVLNGDTTIPGGFLAGKFYLIGNPYPSALDADDFIDYNKNILEGTLYFWTSNTPVVLSSNYKYSTDDYASYNFSGGVAVRKAALSGDDDDADDDLNNDAEPSGKIAAGQGFFAGFSYAGGITYTNDMRRGDADNGQFFKPGKTSKGTAKEKHRVWLNMTNAEGAFKQLLVGYIEGATNNYDRMYDGISFDGNKFIDFYSLSGTSKFVIQGRGLPFADTDTVPLAYKSTIAGDFTISIDHADGILSTQSIFLEDKTTAKIHDLTAANYTFTTGIGTFADRFVLRYTNKTLGTGDFENIENGLLISVKDKTIKVTSAKEIITEVTIFDVNGKLLYNKKKIGSAETQVSNLQSGNQVLLVKVTLENGFTTTRKIIFQ